MKAVLTNSHMRMGLFLGLARLRVAVAAHKLLYATCRVDKLLLAGVERVRICADFQVDDEVLDAIDGLRVIRLGSRNASPLVFAVDEQNWINLRVCAFLHLLIL